MAASSVDTWKSLSASSTCAAVAKGSNLILASDSEILIIASNCLKGNKQYYLGYFIKVCTNYSYINITTKVPQGQTLSYIPTSQ